MSDKWMDAEAFTDRVEEVYDKLSERWDNVHSCDVNHGFFYCCDEEEHDGYRPDTRVRVCDGCGDELTLVNRIPLRFRCYECNFKYAETGERVNI